MNWERNKLFLFKIIRFIIVGIINIILFSIMNYLFIIILKFNIQYSSILSYISVLPCSFICHKYFTFKTEKNKKKELSKFIISNISGIILTILLMTLLIDYLIMPLFLGTFITVLTVAFINFMAFNYWVFKTNDM